MQGALIVSLLLGQAVPADVPDLRLERMRKALEQPPAIQTTQATDRGDRLVYRVTVHDRTFDSSPWDKWATVPSYIRPSYPIYHYEFLMQVTREAFGASVLYPGSYGIDVVPLIKALTKQIEAANHRRREEAARKEVREALAELERARAAVIK